MTEEETKEEKVPTRVADCYNVLLESITTLKAHISILKEVLESFIGLSDVAIYRKKAFRAKLDEIV